MLKIDVNGEVRDMTPEEIAALPSALEPVPHEPTIEERLAAVEAATLDLILGGTL